MAIPAKRGPITATQPDGSIITIQRIGDEHAHITLSANGEPLLYNETLGYVYAEILPDGSMRATDRTASDAFRAVRNTSDEAINAALNYRRASSSRTQARRQMATRAGSKAGYGLFTERNFPCTGEQKALVILVEFQDVAFGSKCGSNYSYSNYKPGFTAHDYFADMLNLKGFDAFGGTGSCRDWFLDNSRDADGNHQFTPSFDLYGPVKLSKAMRSYGANDFYGNDKNPEEMVIEACRALDNEIDFSVYDRDGDGMVDNVYIFYAGYGEADSDDANTIWPHSFSLEYSNRVITLDGVGINKYGCSNEVDFYTKAPDGIGTFTHEFSHVLGLPDLYATTYTSSVTPSAYSVMDYGPYNNNGRTPPNYSTFERYALGWCSPSMFGPSENLSLPTLPDSNKAYIVPTEKDTEYFLIENRQKKGWDRYIPGHGIIVWHIDYNMEVFDNNIVNNDPSHQYVDIVEPISNPTNNNESAWTYPGSRNVTSLKLTSWNGQDTGVSISGISETPDGNIACTVINTKATGIDMTPVSYSPEEKIFYNLQGIRVNNPEKGHVYIIRTPAGSAKIIY